MRRSSAMRASEPTARLVSPSTRGRVWDKIGEDVRRDATGDGVFGEAGEVGIYFGGGTQFACGAEEIGHVAGVEGLLVEEAAFAVGVEDAKIVVVLRARHTARATVGERELAEVRKNGLPGLHGLSFVLFG